LKGKKIQFISDERGKTTAVIVPIELWQEIISEKETAYLLKSDIMRRRLLEARKSKTGVDFDEVRQKLGI
jgi:hypothetical protein